MNQKLMTLDFWQDTVIYEGNTLPTGTIACEALNVSADTIAKMNEQCTIINLLLGLMNAGQNASSVIQIARETAMKMLDILSVTPPFSYMDIAKHRKRIETIFTTENCVRYADCVKQATENLLQLTDVPDYADALTLYRYAAVFGHLAYSLGEYQKAMLDFVKQTDAQTAPYLSADWKPERQKTTGTGRRSSGKTDLRKTTEHYQSLYQAWQVGR